MKGPSSNDTALSEINVTPLVDVMLVLLIIFMVAAPMMQQGVDVALPAVVATDMPADPNLLVITVDRSGKVYVGKETVGPEVLADRLKAIGRNEAYLRADKDVPYGIVVEVMSAMKLGGIEKLGMVTEPVEE